MSFLVAGSHGFLGSAIWRTLQAAGIDARRLCRDVECSSLECVVWRGDAQEFAAAAQAAGISALVLAENSYVAQEKPEWFAECWAANVEFRRQVLPALAGVAGIAVVSLTSYLRVTEPQREYSRAKAVAAEETWAFVQSVSGARMVELMIFDTFGTDDPRPKLLEVALRSELAGQSLQVRTPDAPMLMTNSTVIASIVMDALTRDGVFGTFLVTGEHWTPHGLVSLIHERISAASVAGGDGIVMPMGEVPAETERIGAIFGVNFAGWDVYPGGLIDQASSVDAFVRQRSVPRD